MREMAAACGEARSFACLTMSSPPLLLDDVACDKAMTCAELEVPLVLAGRPSAGSTAPASLAAVRHGRQRRGARRPRPPPARAARRALRLRRRRRRDQHAHHRRRLLRPRASSLGHQAMVDLAVWYGLPSWSYAGHSDSKCSTSSGRSSRRRRPSSARSPGPRCCTTSATSSRACRARSRAGARRRARRLRPRSPGGAAGRRRGPALDEIIAAGPGGDHLARRMTRERHRLLLAGRPHRPAEATSAGGRRGGAAPARARARAPERAPRRAAALRPRPAGDRRARGSGRRLEARRTP